jgi:hypothetical protein
MDNGSAAAVRSSAMADVCPVLQWCIPGQRSPSLPTYASSNRLGAGDCFSRRLADDLVSNRAPLVAWLIAPVYPTAGALQVLRCGC